MNIYQSMKNMRCSANEEEIRKLILQDPYAFAELAPSDMSKKCNVSRATVYRFCDKLGVDGISELKLRLILDHDEYEKASQTFDFDYPVRQGVSINTIADTLREDYEKTLLSTQSLLQKEDMRRCALEMDRAVITDVYTSAGNLYFAENFKFQMKEIAKDVNVPAEEYLQLLTAATSDSSHFAIVISFGGRGWMAEKICRTLRKNGTRFLLIASDEAEKLKPLADYHLYFPNIENHYQKISSFSTRLSLLYLLDILYTCYFELEYERNKESKSMYYTMMQGI